MALGVIFMVQVLGIHVRQVHHQAPFFLNQQYRTDQWDVHQFMWVHGKGIGSIKSRQQVPMFVAENNGSAKGTVHVDPDVVLFPNRYNLFDGVISPQQGGSGGGPYKKRYATVFNTFSNGRIECFHTHTTIVIRGYFPNLIGSHSKQVGSGIHRVMALLGHESD